MKMIGLLCLVIGFAHSGLGSTESTNVPLEHLTMERAVEIALEAHPHLAEAAANLEAARARAEAAGRLPNPDAVARMESAPASSGTTSQAEYVVGLSQTIPMGRRLNAARDVENAGIELREKELDAAAWNLIKSVRGAFATALYTSEVVQAQTNLAANMEEFLRITRIRIEQGDAAPLDMARLEADAAQRRLEIKEAAYLHRVAMHGLAAALGDFKTPIVSLAGNLEDALAIDAIRAERHMLDENPNLAVMESAAAAERARVRLAKSERIPDVNLDLFYRRLQGTRENAFDVGVRIPIPIFDRRRGRVREAESELRAAEARLEYTRNQIHLELRSRELALDRAIESAAVLRNEVLPKIEASVRGAEARYAAGDTSLSDVLAVRREATAARLQHLEALRAVMEAWAGLTSGARTAN